jgi:hypothetical protein
LYSLSVTAINNLNLVFMKKIGIYLLLLAFVLKLSGQEQIKEKTEENKSIAASDTNDNTKVVIGEDLLKVEKTSDAIKVKAGNRGINILESLEGGPKVAFEKFSGKQKEDESDNDDKEDHKARRRQRFAGHWAGLEFGFNNLAAADNSLTMPADINYMSMHSGKSNNFNLNFWQLSLGVSRHAGFVTGMGINWNNYRFDGNFNIQKLSDGTIDSLWPMSTLKKSKLATVYLTLPVMFEVQLPVDNHHIDIAAGFIGAVKLGSHSRMVFQDGQDVKSYSDFSLNMLRGGATARIGYQNLHLYATYYLTPLFKTGMGPGGYDLHPFEIGISLTFRD